IIDEIELIKKLVEKDDMESFEILVLAYREKGLKFALRYNSDYYLAEDLVQEAFARIYVKRKGIKIKGNFKAYLFQIIRNLAIDQHRKQSRIEEQHLTDELNDQGLSPEDEILKNEESGLIKTLLGSLNEKYRTVLYLQKYEEMSYEEIAKIMSISKGQVRMLIYRGKKKLKALIEKERELISL
ncbi:MAG: RNA polymerase sigma factor, partial [Bacillota bacterium]